MHAKFAGLGAKEISIHADNVADIQELIQREILLAHCVLANVDLHALAVLQQMCESGLAHASDGYDPARDAHIHAWLELLGSLVAVLRQYLRNCVREIESMAVGLKA